MNKPRIFTTPAFGSRPQLKLPSDLHLSITEHRGNRTKAADQPVIYLLSHTLEKM